MTPERAAGNLKAVVSLYAPQDETLSAWAQREQEAEAQAATVDALREATPQTPPVTPPSREITLEAMPYNFRLLAERLEEAEEMGLELPDDVIETIGRMSVDFDFVLRWLEGNTSDG